MRNVQPIPSETLAIIAASVTAFLGKKVKVRSARMVQTPYAANPWARQGRVLIQGSHNLGRGGR
jgi:hypothetical protein